MGATTQFEPLGGETYPDTLEEQVEALKTDQQLRSFQEARERLASDPYRPLYHFSVPEHSLGDPNGLCQWRGKYHMFYQFNGPGYESWHWGHTVSDDLVHWEDLPIALYPTTEGACFSGQTLVEPDRVIAMYHDPAAGSAIATAGDPLLLNWKKHPSNPVIPITPDGEPYRVFDPCIWKENDGYYALSGTFKDGNQGTDCRLVTPLFRSQDLAEWEYLGPLLEDGFYTEPGEDGAVPNFQPIGNGKYMLLFFSHKRAAQYYVGEYDRQKHRFTPDYHGRMSYGPIAQGSLNAPSATIDDSGRFLAVFDLTKGKQVEGWTGMMSVPRHLWLDSDNSLCIEPIAELQSLRFDHKQTGPTEIPANGEIVLDGINGKAMEIEATLDAGAAREVGLSVLRSPHGEEQTTVTIYRCISYYDPNEWQLGIDVTRASLRLDVLSRTPEIAPLHIGDDKQVRLRIFVDRSSIEVFVNARQCLTVRVYPDREDSNGVSVFARGGAAKLLSLHTWQMRSIWPELRHREGE